MIVTDPASGRTPVITPRHEHPRSTKRGTDMKRTTLAATVIGALMVSATAFGIGAAVDSPRSLMSPIDYGAAKKAIESDERLAISGCRELDGREKDVCKAEARANERIRKADLEANIAAPPPRPPTRSSPAPRRSTSSPRRSAAESAAKASYRACARRTPTRRRRSRARSSRLPEAVAEDDPVAT